MTLQDRLSEIENRNDETIDGKVWYMNADVPKLIKALRVSIDALYECDILAADRRIDDVIAKSEKAITEIERILNAEGEGND